MKGISSTMLTGKYSLFNSSPQILLASLKDLSILDTVLLSISHSFLLLRKEHLTKNTDGKIREAQSQPSIHQIRF